jgi:hypothetical protein
MDTMSYAHFRQCWITSLRSGKVGTELACVRKHAYLHGNLNKSK